MPTLKNKPTPIFRDKLLHRVIHCLKVRPLLLPQRGKHWNGSQRITVKEIGLVNQAFAFGAQFLMKFIIVVYHCIYISCVLRHDMRLYTRCVLHVCTFVCAIA